MHLSEGSCISFAVLRSYRSFGSVLTKSGSVSEEQFNYHVAYQQKYGPIGENLYPSGLSPLGPLDSTGSWDHEPIL